ncbi:MAG TPA: polysaccharide deacetylase family protein [Terriglobia bacterium]|nr:polysaccharide deacetylase family protein [Terriglobia bacterium]
MVAALLAGLGVLVWYAVAAPESQLLGKTLSRIRSRQPTVALTFDDGPGQDTPAILEILKQAGVRATFFLCGASVERWPELARRIVAEGHEIGNHTYSHPRLLGKTPGKILWEIDRAQKVIQHHTGRVPLLFRPPYGLRWFGLFSLLRQQQLQAVMWSVNGCDWKRPAEQITERVLRQAHPGAIILLHDGVPPQECGSRRATVEALPAILRSLATRYRFATVSETLPE